MGRFFLSFLRFSMVCLGDCSFLDLFYAIFSGCFLFLG